MARFSNKPIKKGGAAAVAAMPTPDTRNRAGGVAYEQSNELKLVTLLATSFCAARYHEVADSQIKRIVELGSAVDPLFAAKTAIWARDVLGMRSASHVLAATIGATVKGASWTKSFFDKVIVRPDDMCEIMAFYKQQWPGKREPHALCKGFAKAFSRFDAYQLKKYAGGSRALKLVDVVNRVHPKGELIDQLHKGTLPQANTWETRLSAATNRVEKEAVWADLIDAGKLGYFALLRNLRNINEQASPRVRRLALEQLVDENRIRKSRVLPFRYYTAFKQFDQMEGSRDLLRAISEAADISVGNIKLDLDGSTLVAVDTSGSMSSQCAGSKHLTCVEAGMLFGAAVYKALDGSDIMEWSDRGKYVNVNPRLPVLDMVPQLLKTTGTVGYGTNLAGVFQAATKKYDRFVIFSDMQVWHGNTLGGLENYCKKHDYRQLPWIHTFDLAGHGTSQFPTNDGRITTLTGFSEKVLQMLSMVESGPDVLVNAIRETEL